MTDDEFMTAAEDCGFTQDQATFLLDKLSLKPHTHTADQILDFDESVTQVIEDTGEEEDDDEDEGGIA